MDRFTLASETKSYINTLTPHFGFNGFGEAVYYRTYSRKVGDAQENWSDTVLRVTEGTFTLRKNHYLRNGLAWRDEDWQDYAKSFATYMHRMRFLPPGRGLWAMGTDFVYERGSAALNNCGAVTTKDLVKGATWMMDMLMNGCGIGFDTEWDGNAYKPDKQTTFTYLIPDSREGWVESLEQLLRAYTVPDSKWPVFDYSAIRGKGAPIKGFGGTASGPEPLIHLHRRVEAYLDTYLAYRECPGNVEYIISELVARLHDIDFPYLNDTQLEEQIVKPIFVQGNKKTYGKTRCIVDIMNAIGCCVVAGNVRRSSEIALGCIGDDEFLNLKNYEINPERMAIGWMSNNTVKMKEHGDFNLIPAVAKRIGDNGEPGIMNQVNITRYGRVGRYHEPGEEWTRELERDEASLCNPCLSGDTLILTDQGQIPITELIGKQFNAMVDGAAYPSTEKGFWCTGEKQLYKITLSNGMTIRATDNHRFKVNNKWTRVDDTKAGDLIAVEFCLSSQLLTSMYEQGFQTLTKLIEDGITCLNLKGFSKMASSDPDLNDIIKELALTKADRVTVVSIDLDKVEPVYDCTIQEAHCFYANGILSHNCSEISLEPFELCNLAEVFPTQCMNEEKTKVDEGIFLQALEFATFYASTVSLLPTHRPETNAVIARNRRIGISLSGVADLYDILGFTELTRLCRLGYRKVRRINTKLAKEAGVPPSIRVTTTKPSGSISQLVGVSPGMHFPTFRYAIRRMRVAKNHPVSEVLIRNNYPYVEDPDSYNTYIFEFPIDQGRTRSAEEVTIWEQFALLAMLQREWSDNMVSCTVYFNPEREKSQLEYVLAQFIPVIKSVSLLPHTKKGVYKYAPYEYITQEEYETMKARLGAIDWSQYNGSDGIMEKYCDGGACVLNT